MKLFISFIFISIFSGCSSLLYYPTTEQHFPPDNFGLHPEEIWIPSANDRSIFGWYFHTKATTPPKAVVLFFHGNGENLSSHYLSLVWLTRYGYDLFIFDYRGYGRSAGDPSPESTVLDGKAALETLYKKDPTLPIVIFGQSLGGAVALRTAIELKEKIPIQLITIDSSFASYRAAARSVLSHHWLTWILQPLTGIFISDTMAPAERMGELASIPLVIIHGDHDHTIDISLGEELYHLASGRKELWRIPGGEHTDSFWRRSPNTRERFLNKLDSLFCLSPCPAMPTQDIFQTGSSQL